MTAEITVVFLVDYLLSTISSSSYIEKHDSQKIKLTEANYKRRDK